MKIERDIEVSGTADGGILLKTSKTEKFASVESVKRAISRRGMCRAIRVGAELGGGISFMALDAIPNFYSIPDSYTVDLKKLGLLIGFTFISGVASLDGVRNIFKVKELFHQRRKIDNYSRNNPSQ